MSGKKFKKSAITVFQISLNLCAVFLQLSRTSQAQVKQTDKYNAGNWVISQSFADEVFIENKGQFNEKNSATSPVLYAVESGEMKMYFSEAGVSYYLNRYDYKEDDEEGREEVREKAEEEFHKRGAAINYKKFERYFHNKCSLVSIEWLGGNKHPLVEVQEKVNEYYTYSLVNGRASIPVRADAWKKLVYKNVYPNIDVVYYFPGNNKGGIKYNIIVHPGGDLSQVKMKYNGAKGLSLDKLGNLIIDTPSDPYTDHAPWSFISGEEGKVIATEFVLSNQVVSFRAASYNTSQTLIVDPWVTNPAFVTNNKGYGIRVDYNGNCYVYGGGTPNFLDHVFRVKKFNSAGVLQWTYTTPPAFMGLYGDIATDRVGNTFVGSGFGFSGGNSVLKLSPAGSQIAGSPIYNPPGTTCSFEQWRLSYNQSTNSGILYMGGGGSEGVQTAKTSTNLGGTPSVYNSHNSAPNLTLNDVVYLAQDETETYIYSNLACSNSCSDPEDRTLIKMGTSTMANNIWRVKNPSPFVEIKQATYVLGGTNCNGQNGMVVGADYVYTFDGAVLTAWNISNGTTAYTVNTGGTFAANSGIDIDKCGRIYVGLNGVIKRYSSTLVFEISIPANGTIYDLQLDPLNDKNIFVTGNGFVQHISLPPDCPTCISTTQTNVLNCTYGTATVTVNDPSATAPLSYSWNTTPVQSTQTATGLASGTYVVTVTDAGSPCPKIWKDTVTITGTYVPCDSTITATGGSICKGNCINLGSNLGWGSAPYTYSWQPGNLSGAAPSVCPSITTTYTLTVTDNAGNTASDTATVSVIPAPVVSVNSPTICAGQAATLTASGATTYTWSAGVTPTGANTATVNPQITSTYTVTGFSNGCKDSAVAVVTVGTVLSITVNSPVICQGDSVALVAQGATSYTWSAGTVAAGTGTVIVSPSVTGSTTYTVTGTMGSCSGTATATVTVNAIPDVQVNSLTICAGEQALLSATGATTYTWSPGVMPVSANTATASPTSNTQYTVTGTSAGCSDTALATVSVNPLPVIAVNAPDVCFGQTATLTATGATSYTWSAGLNPGGTNTATASPPVTTSYTVTGTSNGCNKSVTTTITVHPIPVVNVNSPSICAGDTATLTASGANTYTWSSGLTATGTNTAIASPGSTSTYTVTGTANGCSSTAVSTVTLNASPQAGFNGADEGCAPLDVSFTNTSANIAGSFWDFGDGGNSTATNPVHYYSSPGTYNVSLLVTNAAGCSNSITQQAIVKVYPNPTAILNVSDTSISESDPVVYFNNTSLNASTCLLTFGDGESTNSCSFVNFPHNYKEAGLFCAYLMVSTDHNCVDTTRICIQVQAEYTFYVPNAFTPNGDANNDVFTAYGVNVKEFKMIIFSRWGEQLFQSGDLNLGWDGKVKNGNTIAQEDVYIYKISTTDINNKQRSYIGTVALIR